MRSVCVGVAETGVKAFLFLSFSFFSDKRKEHYKKSFFCSFSSLKSTIKENLLLPFSFPKSNIKSPFPYFGIGYIDICNTDM